MKSLRSSDVQNSGSPAQHYFVSKYNQIKFKAFTQGGKNAATSHNLFYTIFVSINYTIKQRKVRAYKPKFITSLCLG